MAIAFRGQWLNRVLFHSVVLVGLIFAAYLFLISANQKGSMAFDVYAYWSVNLANPYAGAVGDLGFFPYSPAVALVLAPFTALPWVVFVTGWYAMLLAALAFIGRGSILVLLAFPPVAIELYHGNIHLLLAVAIVIGFRHPAAWAFVLLTKVTPGIGLLWFVARREWRQLGIALGATAAIVAVTFVLVPSLWVGWVTMLLDSAGTPPPWPALPIPLWLRLPIAAAIVWWGATRDARWTVPVAAALAVPAMWPGSLAIMAACWPLLKGAQRPTQEPPSGNYHPADDPQRAGDGAQPVSRDVRPAAA